MCGVVWCGVQHPSIQLDAANVLHPPSIPTGNNYPSLNCAEVETLIREEEEEEGGAAADIWKGEKGENKDRNDARN